MGKKLLEFYIQIQLLQQRPNLQTEKSTQQMPIKVSDAESPSSKPNF